MIKKIVAFTLCLICSTTFANTRMEFKNAVSSLTYDLTIVWDQQDKAVFESIVDKFQADLLLMKASGLTDKAIHESLVEMIKDPAERESFEIKARLLGPNESSELGSFIWSRKDSIYSRGASWNGSVDGPTIAFGLIALAIASVIYYYGFHVEYVCTKEGSYSCKEDKYCPYNAQGPSNTCSSWRYKEVCSTPCLEGNLQKR